MSYSSATAKIQLFNLSINLTMAFNPSAIKTASIAPNDCNIPQPGTDGISSLNWSPVANYLVSSNWDGGVRCWEVQEQGGQIRAIPKAQGECFYFIVKREETYEEKGIETIVQLHHFNFQDSSSHNNQFLAKEKIHL